VRHDQGDRLRMLVLEEARQLGGDPSAAEIRRSLLARCGKLIDDFGRVLGHDGPLHTSCA
jgi:hypothetical protein